MKIAASLTVLAGTAVLVISVCQLAVCALWGDAESSAILKNRIGLALGFICLGMALLIF